jgi:hypothetical protein
VPIEPLAQPYRVNDPPASVEPLGDHEWLVEALLPEEPTQIAVDPDQILVDKEPANNFWKTPVRWRFTPIYTFLEETDLTNAFDRWNVIVGPWIYGAAYDETWYTRSTMVGFRTGVYRTQQFDGGAYAAYRTDFRDLVAGVDGLWDHWPDNSFQLGFNIERRLEALQQGNDSALRGVAYARYIFLYGSSLYLQPSHYIEGFASYQDDFLPFAKEEVPGALRFRDASTVGAHYRLNYLTPYWDPEGGLFLDLVYQTGAADLDRYRSLNLISGEFATLFYLPNLSDHLEALPGLQGATRPVCDWLADSRVAVRVYGAMATPTRGMFFSMGGGELFRGFDLSQRQGNAVWVASVEWRVPLAKGLTWDVCDHIVGLRNIYGAAFYDVGDAYNLNHSVGPVAHGVGGGLRLDVAWFGFVERTMLRLDFAKAINADTGMQVWFGIQQPF